MWSDIATGYGLFILEILTILLVIAGIAFMIVTLKQHKAKKVRANLWWWIYQRNTKKTAKDYVSLVYRKKHVSN